MLWVHFQHTLKLASLHVCAMCVFRCFTKIDLSVSLMIFEEKLYTLQKSGEGSNCFARWSAASLLCEKCSCGCLLVIFKNIDCKSFTFFLILEGYKVGGVHHSLICFSRDILCTSLLSTRGPNATLTSKYHSEVIPYTRKMKWCFLPLTFWRFVE